MRGRIAEWSIRAGLVVTSLLVSLMFAEAAVRIFLPLYNRTSVTLDGEVIEEEVKPGSVFRQVSNEYDALTTITDKGHRVPGTPGNPDVIFVGDSFTFGVGLSDDEVFAGIYCREMYRTCANLGEPGGTTRQVRRLRRFLDDFDWQPKEVKLFFFGMSSSFSAGNDFVDNYDEVHGRTRNDDAPEILQAGVMVGMGLADDPVGLAERVMGWQDVLLRHSNLVRVAKYYWGPLLKNAILPGLGEERMAAALAYTKRSLDELDELSRQAGFSYTIYLVVPVQDVIRGTYPDTLAALNSVSPKPAISTAPLFLESPTDFYYAYDGHLNAKGSRRIADWLVSLETAPPPL